MRTYQTTLLSSTSQSGIGIHSARLVDMTLHPAPANTGIIFRRTDISDVNTDIKAHYTNISDVMLNTSLTNDDGVTVGTIEHLMAAFAGMGVDNAIVDVSGAELPSCDGSALPFCEKITNIGIKQLSVPKKYVKVTKPVTVHNDQAHITISPSDLLQVSAKISFEDPFIGTEQYFYVHDTNSFVEELAAARTFCLLGDLTKIHAAGLGLGGSTDNAIVVDNGEMKNSTPLRFTDEFVRHKTLDCIGDLMLAGCEIIGHVNAIRPGHKINSDLVKALMDDETAYTIVEATDLMQDKAKVA